MPKNQMLPEDYTKPPVDWDDPIVADIHHIRQQIMAEFNDDLGTYVAYLRSRKFTDGLPRFRESSLPRVTPNVQQTDTARPDAA
jgi:hypothetical protein